MKLRILAIAVCIICSINLIGQDQFDRLYRTSQRTMTSLDMVEQEGGGTYFLLSKFFEDRDTLHGLNITSLNKKGNVNWSTDYIFYDDSSAVETVGSIVLIEEGIMINTVVVDTLAELANVVVGLDEGGAILYANAYGSNSEELVVGNAILANAVDPMEVFHFGNTIAADGLGLYASKLDLTGNIIWAADLQAADTLASNFDEEVVDIAINFDSTYQTVGTLDGESIFLLNHDENGGQLYSRSYKPTGNFTSEASGVATFADSTTVISAYITNNRGNTTGGLLKLDTLGNVVWSKQLSASLGLGTITIKDVVAGSSGQIAIAGNIEAPDVIGAINSGEYIAILDSAGTVVFQQQFQTIGDTRGTERTGTLSTTEDSGYAYHTTIFDDTGVSDDSLIMRMIKVDAGGNLGMLSSGDLCSDPLVGLVVDDIEFSQDTLVWSATLVETLEDSIGVFEFSYSHQAPTLTLQDSMFCPGDPVMFEFDATTMGAVAYKWFKADEPDMILGRDSVFIGTEIDVDYVAEVKIEIDNCFTLCDTTRLTEIPPPTVSIGRSNSQLCVNNTIVLIAEGSGGNPVWSTGEVSGQILVSEPGNYSVMVTNECDDTDSASISISDADFYEAAAGVVTVDTENCANGVISLFLETTGDVSSVQWNTGGVGRTLAVTEAGTYTATITDICGEISEASAEVTAAQIFECSDGDCPEGSTEAENGCLCWPNAFIPNSNDESNVSFGPNNRCPDISSYNLRIYNRWGEKVFESENVNTEWNGNRGSKRAPSEVYAFYVVYDVEGVTVKDKGHVTLIR